MQKSHHFSVACWISSTSIGGVTTAFNRGNGLVYCPALTFIITAHNVALSFPPSKAQAAAIFIAFWWCKSKDKKIPLVIWTPCLSSLLISEFCSTDEYYSSGSYRFVLFPIYKHRFIGNKLNQVYNIISVIWSVVLGTVQPVSNVKGQFSPPQRLCM